MVALGSFPISGPGKHMQGCGMALLEGPLGRCKALEEETYALTDLCLAGTGSLLPPYYTDTTVPQHRRSGTSAPPAPPPKPPGLPQQLLLCPSLLRVRDLLKILLQSTQGVPPHPLAGGSCL